MFARTMTATVILFCAAAYFAEEASAMYNPAAGRFCSRDPIGYQDGPVLYQYGGGHPSNTLDPSGLEWMFPDYVEPDTADDGDIIVGYPQGDVTAAEATAKCKSKIQKGKNGWVLCVREHKISCVKMKSSGNDRADPIIAGCIDAHEQTHFDDTLPCKNTTGNKCYPPGWKPPLDQDKKKQAQEECKAYQAQLDCLRDKIGNCGLDSDCIAKVNAERTSRRKFAEKEYGCKGLKE